MLHCLEDTSVMHKHAVYGKLEVCKIPGMLAKKSFKILASARQLGVHS